MFTHMLQAY